MDLKIAPLTPSDLDQADRVFRIAFGTRNGLADPIQFDGDAARIRTRALSSHVTALGAWDNDVLVASSIGTAWGTFGWIGPLSVHPDYWNSGIGQQLLGPTIESLEQEHVQHQALFTLGESPKHVALYRKFGFWPGFLILIGQKVGLNRAALEYSEYGRMNETDKQAMLDACKGLTSTIYTGLDLSAEINEVKRQSLGDTICVGTPDRLAGFAVCHLGPGSEASTGTVHIKFGAVRSGQHAEETFNRLLSSCEDWAAARRARRLTAGINTARREVYSAMVSHGFRAIQQGVAMHRPDEPAYDRQGAFVIDDWR